MTKCNFCKSDIAKGTGTLYIKKSGKFAYFCSSKCDKNALKLNRNPTKRKWSSKVKK